MRDELSIPLLTRSLNLADMILDGSTSLLLHHYLQAVDGGSPLPVATLAQRTELINRMLEYFQLHLAEFHNFQSHEILHSVLQ